VGLYSYSMARKINKAIGKLNHITHGEDSKYLQTFKKKAGLVTKEEIKSLEPKNIQELQKKIALLDRYAVAQQKLTDLFGSVNGRVINSIAQNVDLQTKLWELEETLKEEGKNPLLCPEWVRAREMLAKETQFIHKHGLDVADVKSRIDNRKIHRGDDILFEVEEGVEDEK